MDDEDITICRSLRLSYIQSISYFMTYFLLLSLTLKDTLKELFVLMFWFNIVFMIMGGQLDGLLSHWQLAFCK